MADPNRWILQLERNLLVKQTTHLVTISWSSKPQLRSAVPPKPILHAQLFPIQMHQELANHSKTSKDSVWTSTSVCSTTKTSILHNSRCNDWLEHATRTKKKPPTSSSNTVRPQANSRCNDWLELAVCHCQATRKYKPNNGDINSSVFCNVMYSLNSVF